MELEIKCLECGKRTKRFEIGPAAFTRGECNEILLRDNIICPKCKKDISNEKCVAQSGMFFLSMIALTMGMIGETKCNFKIPRHLRGIAVVTGDNYEQLKKQSKAKIALVSKFTAQAIKNEK